MEIFIVDDDAMARRLAEVALADIARESGAPLSIFGDSSEAWRVIQSRTGPALLILDREMPGMDGLELCRRARKAGDFPPLYIVMVTSAAQSTQVAEGLEAGADDYVAKPFHRAELCARAQVGLRMLALQESLAGPEQQKPT